MFYIVKLVCRLCMEWFIAQFSSVQSAAAPYKYFWEPKKGNGFMKMFMFIVKMLQNISEKVFFIDFFFVFGKSCYIWFCQTDCAFQFLWWIRLCLLICHLNGAVLK